MRPDQDQVPGERIPQEASKFAGAFIFRKSFVWYKLSREWQIAALNDRRYEDLKCAGGTNKRDLSETPQHIAVRKLDEEMSLKVREDDLVLVYQDIVDNEHKRYFYLVQRFEGELALRHQGKFVVKWVSVDEFRQRCYENYEQAFLACLRYLKT